MTNPSSSPGVRLEAQGEALVAGPDADVPAFVAAVNARVHIDGLEDQLNPRTLDAGKVRGMLARLPAQGVDVLAALARHPLYLGTPGLGVLQAEPTAADAFDQRYVVTVDRTAGERILAHASFAIDADLARERAAAAQAATTLADQAVQAAEAVPGRGSALGDLRWRRAQAALAWKLIAGSWLAARPDDPAAASSSREAGDAVSRFNMPGGGLRP